MKEKRFAAPHFKYFYTTKILLKNINEGMVLYMNETSS